MGLNVSKVCSSSKLVRVVCLVQSFVMESNLVGLSFSKSSLRKGVILMKKSALSNWSYNRLKLSLAVRIWGVITCLQIRINVQAFGLSCIRSSFSQVSLKWNLNRAGIALISPNNVVVFCVGLTFVYSIGLSVKTINPASACCIRPLVAGSLSYS